MELLKRKIDKYLLDWQNNPERKPLIVKGARQIGKTESIRAFGKANCNNRIERIEYSLVLLSFPFYSSMLSGYFHFGRELYTCWQLEHKKNERIREIRPYVR